jgi:hypothetical protein
MEILKSASKIVFVMISVTACVGFVVGKLPVENFMELSLLAFGFYFSFKGDSNKPYAGK